MRTFAVVFGAFFLVNIVGVIAFLALGKLALLLDPAGKESHLSAFIVAVAALAVAVGSAFPIFGRGVPWAAAHLGRLWPERPAPPERFVP